MGRPRAKQLLIRAPDAVGALGSDGPAVLLELLWVLETEWAVPLEVIDALTGGELTPEQRTTPGTVLVRHRRHRFNHIWLCYDVFCAVALSLEIEALVHEGREVPAIQDLPGELGVELFVRRMRELRFNGRSAYWEMLSRVGLRRIERETLPPIAAIYAWQEGSTIDTLLPLRRNRPPRR